MSTATDTLTQTATRIVYRFAAHHDERARESYRRYFDLKRKVEGKPPLRLVEHAGEWLAVETTRETA